MEATLVLRLRPSRRITVIKQSVQYHCSIPSRAAQPTPVIHSPASNPFLTAATAAGPGSVWAIGYRFELSAYANRTLTMLGS